MAEKIKRTIPWFVVVGIVAILAVLILNAGEKTLLQVVEADTATTSVIVGNATPTLDAVVENPSSDSGSGTGDTAGNPTNEGSDITWNATSTDSNGDDWYLIICTTDSVSTNSEAAPTCGVGTWQVTGTTTSGSMHTTATSTTGLTSESYAWYAFACDYNTDQKCSLASQGTGSAAENSPFYVNHRPVFDTYADDSPKDPNETVTWTTSGTTDDPDSDGGADTIVLWVCDSSGFTCGGTPDCTDTTLASTTPAVESDATTSYNIASIKQDKDYGAYGYLIDNHGFCNTAGEQGADSVLTVANVAPTVTDTTISFVDAAEGDTDLDLTVPEGETTGFEVHATITDKNSCLKDPSGSEIATNTDASVTKAWVYRSGVGSSCSASTTDCYLDLADCTLGPCGGADDDTVTTTCTFSMWYVADPTDSTSYFPTENWLTSLKAVDDDDASSTTEVAAGYESEMISYPAYDLVTNTTLDYGMVGVGATSSEATTTIKAIGNTGLDNEISGENMTSTGNTIIIDQQHFSSITGFAWADGITATTTPAHELEIDCKKTTETSTPATSSTYWIIKIPGTQVAGTYSGTNTIVGVISETSTWY